MADNIRTDYKFLRKRMALILARQIKYLKETQLDNGFLTDEQLRQYKTCNDAMDDQAKLARTIESDIQKALEKMVDSKLKALGESATESVKTPKYPL